MQAPGDTVTILVIEDDPTIRALMIAILSRAGRHVEVVESAEAALAWISDRGGADLYLVDKNLPRMSGVDLIERIRAQDDIAAVVMVTGYASSDSVFRTLNLGVDAYLEKPFEVDVIEQQVESALERRARRSELHEVGHTPNELRDTLERARAELRSIHDSPNEPRPATVRFLAASPHAEERKRMRDLLGSGGDSVELVASAQECVARLDDGFDVIILDSALRNPAVVEVARRVQREGPNRMCLVIGERPAVDDLRQLIELGVKAVIERHDIATQLRSRVDALLTGVRLRRLKSTP